MSINLRTSFVLCINDILDDNLIFDLFEQYIFITKYFFLLKITH